MYRPDRAAVDRCINRCLHGENSRSGTASSDSLIQAAPSKMPIGTATVGESAYPKQKSKKPGGEWLKPSVMGTAQINQGAEINRRQITDASKTPEKA